MDITWLKTCKDCATDNPADTKRCNGCGKAFDQLLGGAKYVKRWACGKCGAINMEDNSTCHGCHEKRDGGLGFWWVPIIFVGFVLLQTCSKG